MMLIKFSTTVTACVLTVAALSGCAPDPGTAVPGGNAEAQMLDELDSASSPGVNRSATGILTSIDGQTTGRVEVQIEEVTDDFGTTSPLATVKFFDLVSPYDHLTPGGALAPRGDDPCFDTGIRSGGGTIFPDADGFATATMPAEDGGYSLHEILLHLDWTQIDSETEACMQPVVARAPLTWAE